MRKVSVDKLISSISSISSMVLYMMIKKGMYFRILTFFLYISFLIVYPQLGFSQIVWSASTGATAWYTAGNWSPSTSSAAWTTSDIAQFQNSGSATTSGINMGTASLSIGAIEITSARTRALTIGNSSPTSGTLTLNGANINSVASTILRSNMTSNFTLQNNETGSGKTMNIALGNATNNVVNVDSTGNIVISSNISGSSRKLTLNAASSGDLRLSGSNTFSGGVEVNGSSTGKLRIDAVASLPTSGSITVNTGGRLTLNVAGTYGGVSQSLTFNPNQTTNPSLDILSNAAIIWQGTVAINADTRIESNGASGSLTFSGNVSGSGLLMKQASGTLTLSGTGNSMTGGTQIGNGTLTVNSGSSMGTGGLNMFQTSTNNTALNLNESQTISSLTSNFTAVTGTQTQIITIASTKTLTVNQSTNTTYGTGSVSTLTSTIAGSGALTKSGSGTLTLTSGNTYTGLTTVSNGILQFNRSGGTTIPATNDLTVNGGTAKFSSNQTLNDVVVSSGTLMVDAGVTLTINGNFTGGGIIQNNGTIVLVGPSSFPGSGTTVSAMNNLTINRTGGVTLDQSITITGNLTFTNGKLITGTCNSNTSNVALTIADNATITGSSSARFVDGILKKTGDDAFTFPIGNGSKYAPVSINAPLVNTDRFAACYISGNPNANYSITSKAGSLNNVSKMEYWHINREVGSSSTNVTLSWDTTMRSGPVRNMNDLRVCRWDGSQWDDLANTGTTGSNASGTVTSGSVSSFSPFTLGSASSANPLPVTWASFTAETIDGGNKLYWSTASEQNTSHYELEYSTDGLRFFTFQDDIVAGGNSASLLQYSYFHAFSAPMVYYRIKQVDLDGQYSYSKTIVVKNKMIPNNNFVYVSPSLIQHNEPLIIKGSELGAPYIIICMSNAQGQTLVYEKIPTTDSYYNYELLMTSLTHGIYYIHITDQNLKQLYQGKIRK